jgi:centromere protein I
VLKARLLKFSELYNELFAPLEARVIDGSAESQLAMLKCYSTLLRHWITILLSGDSDGTEYSSALSELIGHVNKLCLTVVQSTPDASTYATVLEFYELTAFMVSTPKLNGRVRIDIPPSALVYILYFNSSPVTISRLCGVLTLYKEGLQAAMAESRTAYPVVYVNRFNGYLMDICNCVWRSRAFNAKDANANACLVPENVNAALANYISTFKNGSNLTSLFTLSASPAFGLMATSYLRELEDVELEHGSSGLDTRHAGPVSKASLLGLGKNGGVSLTWDEYRLGVLGYLEQQGMGGVGRLMHSTMTTLAGKTRA